MKRERRRRQRHKELHDLTTAVRALTTELRAWRTALAGVAPPTVVMPLKELLRQRTRRDPNDPLAGYEALE